MTVVVDVTLSEVVVEVGEPDLVVVSAELGEMTGPAGPPGSGGDGGGLLYGTAEPNFDVGEDGEFYVQVDGDNIPVALFGPKTSGAWPDGAPLGGDVSLQDITDAIDALNLGTAATADTGDFDAAGAAAAAQAAAIAASQPVDSDLTAIAALATTSFGRGLLTLADAAAGRTALALGTAATQSSSAFDPAGTAAAAVAALVASAPSALDTLDEIAAAFGDDANFATTITDLIATKQPLDSDLTAIAALSTTSYGRAFLSLADAAAGRTALGLGTAATQATSAFEASGAVSTHAALTSSVHGITSAAATVLDDTTTAAMLVTLGALPQSGWIPLTALPTYVSGSNTNTRVYAYTDPTGQMSVGWRARWLDTTKTGTTYGYGIITALDDSTDRITVFTGTDYVYADTSNPTAFWVSPAKAPLGFQTSPTKWTVTLDDSTLRSQASPTQNQTYTPGSLTFTIPIGAWRLNWTGGTRVNIASGTGVQMSATLSTNAAGSAFADSTSQSIHTLMRTDTYMSGATGLLELRVPIARSMDVVMTAATTYNLAILSGFAAQTSISLDNANTPMRLTAVCAYL